MLDHSNNKFIGQGSALVDESDMEKEMGGVYNVNGNNAMPANLAIDKTDLQNVLNIQNTW